MRNSKLVLKRLARLMAVMMVMAVLVTGCNSEDNPSGDNSSGTGQGDGEKVVTVAISGDISLLGSDAVLGSGDILPFELMYEPLVKFGEDGKILPALAEEWDISASGKEYTFYLRKGVRFSDGTDFNADTVIFNAGRWEGKSATASLSLVNEMEKIEIIDEYTIKMTFKKSYYPYLTELTYPRPCRILGVNSVSALGDIKAEFVKPVGTGPWMLESHEDNSRMVFVPNPYYYGEKPKADKLILKVITDPQSRVMALQSGEIDFSMAQLPLESQPVIQSETNLKIMERVGTNSYHLMFNYENPVLADLNVRRAVNYAIDKQSIVDNLLDGMGQPGKGIFPDTVPYVDSNNNKGYGYNPDEAKKLLAASGYKDSDGDGIVEKDGKPLRLSLVFQNSEYPEWKPLCEMLQSEIKKVGIDIDLQLRETNAYYDAIWSDRSYDMIIYRTYEDSWNPHGFLTSLYYKPEGGKAVAWYDKSLNNYLDETFATTDESTRQSKYDQIFNLMYDQAVCVPLYYPVNLYVYNTRLTNVKQAPTCYDNIDWSAVDIAK